MRRSVGNASGAAVAWFLRWQTQPRYLLDRNARYGGASTVIVVTSFSSSPPSFFFPNS